MDYSKFYLKNYVPEPSEEAEDSPVLPRIETRPQPEIIYINPDGEVFDPEQSSEPHSDEHPAIDYAEKTVDIYSEATKKAPQAKKSFANRFCQTILIFAIVIMSLIVSADFITDGKAVAAMTQLFSGQTIEYYAVLQDGVENAETCKVNAYAMRLKGGAGFTVKNGDLYYNVYSLFESKSEAEEYAEQNGGELLILKTDYYDDLDGELKNYIDYPVKTCADLNNVLADLTNKEITTTQALDKLNDIKEDFAVEYDNMDNAAQSDSSDKSIVLIANASVALAALDYLCDTTVSRPNLACDIRYTICRIMFTYCYSK